MPGKSRSDSTSLSKPPDGGFRAWLIVVCAFLCQGVIFGVINSYSVIHAKLQENLVLQNVTGASTKAGTLKKKKKNKKLKANNEYKIISALVGSLTFGTTLLTSPISGIVSDKFGLPLATFFGGLVCLVGIFSSSFFTQSIQVLYVTYGVLFGFGCALVYTPTVTILGHYFVKHLGKVSGFTTTGASVFTVILPPLLSSVIKDQGLDVALRYLAVICLLLIVAAIVYKPTEYANHNISGQIRECKVNHGVRPMFNTDLWKRKRYIVWALCCMIALLGYYVPYVHMVEIVHSRFAESNENLPIMGIGITSCVGRLICGLISDLKGVKKIYLHQISLAGLGVLTSFLSMTNDYMIFLVLTLVMGFFDGFFISILGPIVYELCGPSGANQGVGFFFGLISIPIAIGPPLAGLMYDSLGSYSLALVGAGLLSITGALLMFFIECVDNGENEGN